MTGVTLLSLQDLRADSMARRTLGAIEVEGSSRHLRWELGSAAGSAQALCGIMHHWPCYVELTCRLSGRGEKGRRFCTKKVTTYCTLLLVCCLIWNLTQVQRTEAWISTWDENLFESDHIYDDFENGPRARDISFSRATKERGRTMFEGLGPLKNRYIHNFPLW